MVCWLLLIIFPGSRKCTLKDGIINLNGKDFLFSKVLLRPEILNTFTAKWRAALVDEYIS